MGIAWKEATSVDEELDVDWRLRNRVHASCIMISVGLHVVTAAAGHGGSRSRRRLYLIIQSLGHRGHAILFYDKL